jgi:hypothetical protein
MFDSGASSSSSPHCKGAIRFKRRVSKEDVAFDGNVLKIKQRYDMAGVARNAAGEDVAKVTISGVNHVPCARFNLFSGPYAVSQGWTFFGDSSGVTLTKGQAVLKFDLLIPQVRGIFTPSPLSRKGPKISVQLV